MASSDSQIDKPQHGHSTRAELLDVNINTGDRALILRTSLRNYTEANIKHITSKLVG